MLNRFCRLIGASAVALVMLSASSDHTPTFDTSSEAAYLHSLAEVRGRLTPERQEALAFAIKFLLPDDMRDEDRKRLAGPDPAAALAANPAKRLGLLKTIVGGKTADQVIRESTLLRIAALEKLRDKYAAEARAAEDKLASYEKSIAEGPSLLAQFRFSEVKYYWSKGHNFEEAVLDFTITNNSKIAISRIYVTGVLRTPGRAVPWATGAFNHYIKGGLEPGETRHLSLTPTADSEFNHADLKRIPKATLTLTLVNLDGADAGIYDFSNPIIFDRSLEPYRQILTSTKHLHETVEGAILKARKDLDVP